MATSIEENIFAEVKIVDGVNVTMDGNTITAKGKAGTVKKDFTKLPANIKMEGKKITIRPYGTRKRDLAITNTARSIIDNMIKGADKGFTYKLKIVFAHFPISVKIKGKEVQVENFFGERSPRKSAIVGDATKVTVAGEDILITGPNLEEVSQTAANIESSTKLKGKDQRVFLDGLYIYSRESGMQTEKQK